MTMRMMTLIVAAAATAAVGAAPAGAQRAATPGAPAAPATQPAQPPSFAVQTVRAMTLINADAAAILNALQWDPALADQLVKNPAGAQAVLRSRGAIRAERIVVEKSAPGRGTLTITISIANVSTTLSI